MFIPCPVCNRQISDQESACPGCGTPVAVAAAPVEGIPAGGGVPNDPAPATTVYAYASRPGTGSRGARTVYSEVQPVWQYVLLQFCTVGAYDLVWFYRTWRLLKERHHLHIWPGARAIFRELFGVHLCRQIYKLAADAGHKPSWNPVTIGWVFIISDIIGNACGRQESTLAFVLSLVFFAASVSVRVPLVRSLNELWLHEQPDLPIRTRLSGGAWAVVILGSLFWIAGLLGNFAEQSGFLSPGE